MNFVLKTGTIEEGKAQILLKLRRYRLIRREEQEPIISLLARIPRERKNVLIWCIQARVVGVAYVEKLKKAMKVAEAGKGMIVANTRYSFAAKKRSKKYGIELIPKRFPSFNIFKHKFVPKHEILLPAEAKELMEKYRVKPYQLPQMREPQTSRQLQSAPNPVKF